MKVSWHKGKDPQYGYTYWYAEALVEQPAGNKLVRVAEARMTSHTGTEDYPWEWFYTDEGVQLRIPAYANVKRTEGVHSRLKDIKQMVKEQLGA